MIYIPPELQDMINDILAHKDKEELERLEGGIEELKDIAYIEDFYEDGDR